MAVFRTGRSLAHGKGVDIRQKSRTDKSLFAAAFLATVKFAAGCGADVTTTRPILVEAVDGGTPTTHDAGTPVAMTPDAGMAVSTPDAGSQMPPAAQPLVCGQTQVLRASDNTCIECNVQTQRPHYVVFNTTAQEFSAVAENGSISVPVAEGTNSFQITSGTIDDAGNISHTGNPEDKVILYTGANGVAIGANGFRYEGQVVVTIERTTGERNVFVLNNGVKHVLEGAAVTGAEKIDIARVALELPNYASRAVLEISSAGKTERAVFEQGESRDVLGSQVFHLSTNADGTVNVAVRTTGFIDVVSVPVGGSATLGEVTITNRAAGDNVNSTCTVHRVSYWGSENIPVREGDILQLENGDNVGVKRVVVSPTGAVAVEIESDARGTLVVGTGEEYVSTINGRTATVRLNNGALLLQSNAFPTQ